MLLSEGPLRPAAVRVVGELIAEVVEGAAPPGEPVQLLPDGAVLVPGLVDLQVNGYAGADLQSGDVAAVRSAARAMARDGVSAFAGTVVTAPVEQMRSAVEALVAVHAAPLPGEARVAAVHLEGPFLAPAARGVHPVEHLRLPDAELAGALLPPSGVPAVVTLAPELPGALDLVGRLVAGGVRVALGHTRASAEVARAAVDAGARLVTHLWNAQSGAVNREPGVAALALTDPRVVAGLIADLTHVDPVTLALSWAAAPGRLALVTDATSASAAPAGAHRLGPARLVLGADGVPRDAEGRLAGSALRLVDAIGNVVAVTGDVEGALRAATSVPAAALGLGDQGLLRVGARADLAVLAGGSFGCLASWLGGRPLPGAP